MARFSTSRRRFCAAVASLGTLPVASSVIAGDAPRAGRARPRVAVCFGSGALHGYAHVGAINAFERHGFKPDVICGTSVGAIVGVLWAAGLDADSINELASDEDLFTLGLPRLSMFGPGKLTELSDFLEEQTGGRRIEALPTVFACVATDLDSGRMVTLKSGSAARVVVASASMPLRYEPVVIGQRRLVDGALTAPVPIDAARELGADFIIGIDVAYRPYEEPVDDFDDVPFQMFHIMVNHLIAEQLRRADMSIRMDVHEIMRDSDDMTLLIRAGEAAVEKAWPGLERHLRQPSG